MLRTPERTLLHRLDHLDRVIAHERRVGPRERLGERGGEHHLGRLRELVDRRLLVGGELVLSRWDLSDSESRHQPVRVRSHQVRDLRLLAQPGKVLRPLEAPEAGPPLPRRVAVERGDEVDQELSHRRVLPRASVAAAGCGTGAQVRRAAERELIVSTRPLAGRTAHASAHAPVPERRDCAPLDSDLSSSERFEAPLLVDGTGGRPGRLGVERCTVTQSPPSRRGAMVSVPSWAWVMLLTIARPRPTPAWSVRVRSVPRWNGSVRVEIIWGVRVSPVFSTVSTADPWRMAVSTRTVPWSGRLCTMAFCRRFVVICSRSACEPMVGVMSPDVSMVTPCFSASGRSASVASSATRDRSTRSVVKDRWSARLSSSSASVRSIARAVDRVEALDELADVAVRIVAGDVEQGLRDRQWRAQLVGRVGGEPPLLGDVCFEPSEHGVEAVGQLTELVVASFQLDPVRERSARRHARGVGDARQGGEHPTGEQPPSHETEHQQERQHRSGPRREDPQEAGPDGKDARRVEAAADQHRSVGDVAQEEQPHGREQQGAGEHQEPGVAEGELEADAHPRRPIHPRLHGVGIPNYSQLG